MKQFGFTYDTDIKDFSKFEGTFLIENILNENLKLNNYGDKIQKIVFVYLAVNTDNFKKTENFIKYRTKSKTIEIGVNLPYNEFIAADKPTALKLLKDAYITGIDTLLSKRKDFESIKFLEDFKKII